MNPLDKPDESREEKGGNEMNPALRNIVSDLLSERSAQLTQEKKRSIVSAIMLLIRGDGPLASRHVNQDYGNWNFCDGALDVCDSIGLTRFVAAASAWLKIPYESVSADFNSPERGSTQLSRNFKEHSLTLKLDPARREDSNSAKAFAVLSLCGCALPSGFSSEKAMNIPGEILDETCAVCCGFAGLMLNATRLVRTERGFSLTQYSKFPPVRIAWTYCMVALMRGNGKVVPPDGLTDLMSDLFAEVMPIAREDYRAMFGGPEKRPVRTEGVQGGTFHRHPIPQLPIAKNVIGVVLGVILLLGMVVLSVWLSHPTWKCTDGEVFARKVQDGTRVTRRGASRTETPIERHTREYRYWVNGKRYLGTSVSTLTKKEAVSAGLLGHPSKRGEPVKVKVYYDSSCPENSELRDMDTVKMWPFVLWALMALGIIVSNAMAIFKKRGKWMADRGVPVNEETRSREMVIMKIAGDTVASQLRDLSLKDKEDIIAAIKALEWGDGPLVSVRQRHRTTGRWDFPAMGIEVVDQMGLKRFATAVVKWLNLPFEKVNADFDSSEKGSTKVSCNYQEHSLALSLSNSSVGERMGAQAFAVSALCDVSVSSCRDWQPPSRVPHKVLAEVAAVSQGFTAVLLNSAKLSKTGNGFSLQMYGKFPVARIAWIYCMVSMGRGEVHPQIPKGLSEFATAVFTVVKVEAQKEFGRLW